MPRKAPPQTPEEIQRAADAFLETIELESDRGCVLVAAAFLDEALEMLLRAKMVTDSAVLKDVLDPLFVTSGALGSFRTKIDLCRALGLLGHKNYSDLLTIRNLRNYFAHSYVEADFGSQKVVDLVSNLRRSKTKVVRGDIDKDQLRKDTRLFFSVRASWLSGQIHAGVSIEKEKKHEL